MSLLEDAIDHILNDLCFDAFEAGENHGRPPDSSAYTRRVLALLQEHPWFDGAVNRMTSVPLRLFDESNAAVRVSREHAADLLLAALGKDTE